jgi:uncharacterized membrane protein
MPAEQSQVISTLGLVPIMAVLLGRGDRLSGRRERRGCILAVLSGLVGSFGNLAFYRLMSAGQSAATVVPLTSLYPLVTVVLAVLLLKERLNLVQAGGVALALVAIYLFNVGRAEPFTWAWFAFAMLPVVLWGLSGLLQKMSTNAISAELSTLCFLAALVPLSVVLVFAVPMNWSLPVADWLWAIALGLLLGLGNLTVLAAFATGGKAAIVAPMAGLYPAITVALAVGFLGERVRSREWLAIGLALVAVVALSRESPAKPSKTTIPSTT